MSYISTNTDDGSIATNLIKIDIYDLKKLANVGCLSDHWKHASVYIQYGGGLKRRGENIIENNEKIRRIDEPSISRGEEDSTADEDEMIHTCDVRVSLRCFDTKY